MNQLTFQSTALTAISHNNQTYLTSSDLARALGYARTDSVSRIYERNQDEFTTDMTTTVKLTVVRETGSVDMDNRIFSLRGAHLIAMFARTPVAKEFRKWVLDILDKEAQNPQPIALPKPVERSYIEKLTAKEIHNLVWLWYSQVQMNELLGHLVDPLDKIGSRFSPTVYSHHHEYKRQYQQTLPTLRRLVQHLKNDNPLEWERLHYRLDQVK